MLPSRSTLGGSVAGPLQPRCDGGVQVEELQDIVRRLASTQAAFGRDAEIRNCLAGGGRASDRTFDAVGCVHQPQEQACPGRKREIGQRGEECVVVARDRDRQVDIADGAPDVRDQCVRQRHHAGCVQRFDEVLCVEIAVAKVESQLDIRRNVSAEPLEPLDNRRLVGDIRIEGRVPIPQDHLDAHIPLDAEVLVRDLGRDRGDLVAHGRLVGGLDLRDRILGAECIDDRERRGQAHLKPAAVRHPPALARPDEVLI